MSPPVNANFDRRKVFELARDNNYLRHRETYHHLRRFLETRFTPPFTILDIGCGDAGNIATALQGLEVRRFTGVDISPGMLLAARENLSALPCRHSLHKQDALAFLRHSRLRVDIVWIGLLLHHFPRVLKQGLFTLTRQRLRSGGCLLAHDPVLRENENRADYIRRLARICRRDWRAISATDLTVLQRHWTNHGRQARFSTLARLANRAGFSHSDILYRDPHKLYALTLFTV